MQKVTISTDASSTCERERLPFLPLVPWTRHWVPAVQSAMQQLGSHLSPEGAKTSSKEPSPRNPVSTLNTI